MAPVRAIGPPKPMAPSRRKYRTSGPMSWGVRGAGSSARRMGSLAWAAPGIDFAESITSVRMLAAALAILEDHRLREDHAASFLLDAIDESPQPAPHPLVIGREDHIGRDLASPVLAKHAKQVTQRAIPFGP